jgi:hypothetical protein
MPPGDAKRMAAAMIKASGRSAEQVARATLAGVDADRHLILPDKDVPRGLRHQALRPAGVPALRARDVGQGPAHVGPDGRPMSRQNISSPVRPQASAKAWRASSPPRGATWR